MYSSQKVKQSWDHLSGFCLLPFAFPHRLMCHFVLGTSHYPACASVPLSAGPTFIISQVTRQVVCLGTQRRRLCNRDKQSPLFTVFLGACLMRLFICIYINSEPCNRKYFGTVVQHFYLYFKWFCTCMFIYYLYTNYTQIMQKKINDS